MRRFYRGIEEIRLRNGDYVISMAIATVRINWKTVNLILHYLAISEKGYVSAVYFQLFCYQKRFWCYYS